MRIMFFAMGLIAALPITASAEESVDGYDRQDGTYVEPYVRTDPNDTPTDNYSKRAVRRRVGRFGASLEFRIRCPQCGQTSSANADGSVDLYVGPNAPPGKEANWLRSVPGKATSSSFGSTARQRLT